MGSLVITFSLEQWECAGSRVGEGRAGVRPYKRFSHEGVDSGQYPKGNMASGESLFVKWRQASSCLWCWWVGWRGVLRARKECAGALRRCLERGLVDRVYLCLCLCAPWRMGLVTG